ncbi:sugar phosphate isomerase/epimerase family protein [Zavarzinia sp.]|uniref:sugar phosphate isomerase/epimerase family protein n=1 Tax=Zavarzinia sp. TaxID=2027920 RepID=UPI003BB5ECC2
MGPRLAVSNLAWPPALESSASARLTALGVAGVEVAPTRIANWEGLTPEVLKAYRSRLADVGLKVSSLQALLFGVEGAQLLGDNGAFGVFRSHLERVAHVGNLLGARVAVFGAPRSRLLLGHSSADAMSIAADRLRLLAPLLQEAELVLGIEPVPGHYGGEFLTHADQVAELVRRVDDPAIRLHLDTGCVLLGGEAIGEKIVAHHPILAHFHAAETDLAGFDVTKSDHVGASEALAAVNYDHWISIEMKPQAPDPLIGVERAVRYVQQVYFGRANSDADVPV